MINNVMDKVQGKTLDRVITKKFDGIFGGDSEKKEKKNQNEGNNSKNQNIFEGFISQLNEKLFDKKEGNQEGN